jgi:SAM-dependent methyltransferase
MNNQALALVRAAGQMLPFPDESADGVFAECSLSVMNDPGRALDEFQRVLRTGGKLILSDVYARNPEGAVQLKGIPLECCLRGAFRKEELLGKLTNSHFRIDLWEDHSELLARFAAQLIFCYGSMDQFWLRSSAGSVNAEEIQRAVAAAKPGYFLLIAQKIGGAGAIPGEDS